MVPKAWLTTACILYALGRADGISQSGPGGGGVYTDRFGNQQRRVPGGTVLFHAGGTELGSANLANGTAAGTYSMTAYYAGGKNNPATTATPVTLTVD